MCGISGISYRDGRQVDVDLLHRMGSCLRHRGPDDEGVYASGETGLAHTRLSIIDLTADGRQPMRSDDGRFALTYNGEVYNFPALRRSLEEAGHRFRGRSDTEVVLHAFMEWGERAFPMLEGMFAMAVWDDREKRLHLARDRFGIKPLYYWAGASSFVFGSEIKALLASGEVAPRMDWHGLHEYLYYNTALGARTLYAGVRKLLPGHKLTLHAELGLNIEQYGSIFDVEPVADDFPTAVERVRELLDRAVSDHLVSDVPVGVFLSGGIDSSAITAFASRHYAGRLRTYSAGFDFEGARSFNELPKARLVAEHFGTDHHELHVAGGDAASVIERLIGHHDAPFGDAANIPLYLLCEQLGGDNKVILQGDGGDEIFAGYRTHSLMAIDRWARMLARSSSWAAPFIPLGARFYPLLQRLIHSDRALRFALIMANSDIDDPPALVFGAEARLLLETNDPFSRYRELYHCFEHLDVVQRALYTDCGTLLPDVFFEKVDKATMAHGIEARVPLVDTRLASYVMGLPAKYKVRGFHKKRVLRQALRGVVPDSVLDHPKVGFGVPVSHWLRTTLAGYMRSVLLDASRPSASLFDGVVLRAYVEDHIAGRRNRGRLLYRLLNLALWYDGYGVSA